MAYKNQADANKYMRMYRKKHPQKITKEKRNEYMKTYRTKHPDRCIKYRKKYYRKNIEKFREKRKSKAPINRKKALEYFYKNRELCRDRQRKFNYGITREQYEELISSQSNLCAICSTKMDKTLNRVIDHDHKTGKVRGILCRKCNFGIGLLNDSILIVESALNYLKHHA